MADVEFVRGMTFVLGAIRLASGRHLAHGAGTVIVVRPVGEAAGGKAGDTATV